MTGYVPEMTEASSRDRCTLAHLHADLHAHPHGSMQCDWAHTRSDSCTLLNHIHRMHARMRAHPRARAATGVTMHAHPHRLMLGMKVGSIKEMIRLMKYRSKQGRKIAKYEAQDEVPAPYPARFIECPLSTEVSHHEYAYCTLCLGRRCMAIMLCM